jgi:hypothetical protein
VNPRNLILARNAHPEERGDHFAAPLGSSRSGRLRFMNGPTGPWSDPTRVSGASTARVSGAGRRRWACWVAS